MHCVAAELLPFEWVSPSIRSRSFMRGCCVGDNRLVSALYRLSSLVCGSLFSFVSMLSSRSIRSSVRLLLLFDFGWCFLQHIFFLLAFATLMRWYRSMHKFTWYDEIWCTIYFKWFFFSVFNQLFINILLIILFVLGFYATAPCYRCVLSFLFRLISSIECDAHEFTETHLCSYNVVPVGGFSVRVCEFSDKSRHIKPINLIFFFKNHYIKT